MKKMIVLVGLFMAQMSFAGEIVNMPMLDLLPTDMDAVFEIKTTKFDKVLLDCQSLRMGMSFSSNGEIKSDIYLNESTCNEMFDFLNESKQENLPVCIGLDHENQELIISRDTDECI